MKNPALTCCWVELDDGTAGYGITAYDRDDALDLLRRRVFGNGDMPVPARVEADVDLSTLDGEHVLPSSGVATWRGVWYPNIGPESER